MQNLFMVWLVFAGMCIVTTADSATESNMKGHILKFNNTIILTLTCSSSMQIFDNMAEFLIDHKSSEVIKYYNGLCFDKNGVCLKTKCTCLKSGNSYSWIYKSRAIPKWQEFSCMINIRDDMNGIQYSVYTTLIYNGTELVMNGTERLIINGPIKKTTETMHTRETSGHHVKFVGIGVPVAIIIMIGGICIYYRSHLQQTRRPNLKVKIKKNHKLPMTKQRISTREVPSFTILGNTLDEEMTKLTSQVQTATEKANLKVKIKKNHKLPMTKQRISTREVPSFTILGNTLDEEMTKLTSQVQTATEKDFVAKKTKGINEIQPLVHVVGDSFNEFEEDLSDDDDGNKNIPKYNRELNKRYIKDWLDEDRRFIPTTASMNVEDMVKKRNCVLVVGGSGEGKTSLIRHIALKLMREEDYDIVPIVMVPLIISQFYNAKRKQVFVVDDFCGRDRIYETSLDLWVLPHYTNLFADIIESDIRLDQKDVSKKSTKILIACNRDVYNDPLFDSLDFYKQYSVILSNWPISDNERQHIRKNQLLEGSVKDLQLKGFSFPLLCKLSHGKLSDQIRAFFENPFECIKQDIKNIKEQQDVQFYVICLLALFDNSFNVDWLSTKHLTEMEKNSIDDISSHFNINLEDELHKELIKGSLDILEKTYLFKSDRTYRIVDDKIYDIAATICGEFLFCHFVNYASSKFLAERYKLETIQSESDEMKMFICIKRGKENFYFDRLIRDLENGDTYSFLHNKQLQHSIYREKFMKHCRKESRRIRTILVKLKDKENNNSSQKDKSVSPIEFEDLEDNSCYTYLKLNPTIEIARIGIPLIESIIEGYEEIVNFLIEMGSDVNVIHTFGRSALYISAVLGYKDILQLLITKKANISLCDHKGRSALYIACKMGHDEIVDKLLGTIQCEVEQCDDTQSTPLHAASLMGHDHVVKILLRKKHKIDPLDNQDRTPLFLASECGHTEVVSTLIHAGSNLSAKNKNELTPLFAACNNNKKAVADLLLKQGASITEVDRNGRSPLLIASNNGSDEVVKLLLDENIKADIEKCDNQGCSALYLACDGGHETTVNLLLENGCSVNKCNANGMSPLHVACVKGIVNMVNTLLSHNASVEAVDHDRQTALHLNCDKGNIHTLKLLLEHKNIININDKHGDSPLHVACKRGSKKIVELIMGSGADIDHYNSKEKQPLHIACCEGHYEIVNVLSKRHAEINRKDIDGATPLFLACKMGHIQITRLLIERKADVRICDHQKWSPLHVACNRNHYDIVQALLDKAPDIISEKDNQGKTALDFALKISDSSKIVELLKEKTHLNKSDNN